MGFFSKDIKSLEDLFLHTLRNMYYAEKKVAKVIPARPSPKTTKPNREPRC